MSNIKKYIFACWQWLLLPILFLTIDSSSVTVLGSYHLYTLVAFYWINFFYNLHFYPLLFTTFLLMLESFLHHSKAGINLIYLIPITILASSCKLLLRHVVWLPFSFFLLSLVAEYLFVRRWLFLIPFPPNIIFIIGINCAIFFTVYSISEKKYFHQN